MAKLPRVIVKWAQTLDGRAAAADGSSQWITGPAARADVHRRRADAAAILVGTGTLLADDPSLTARTPEGELLVPAAEQPVPVVVGSRAIPSGARVLAHPALGERFPEPIRLSGNDLAADLASLGTLGIESVFVEGGPHIVSSLLRAGLVDELLVYIAPALLGGPRLAVGDLGIASMTGIHRLEFTHTEQLGPDLLIIASSAQKEIR
ncbi:RibD family protein [Leucobacter sp. BZR 635]